MQKFEFRGPRFPVDLPVQLTIQNSKLPGRCTEISKEGMKLEVGQVLESNALGTVSMNHLGQTHEFRVRVAHVGPTHGGLEFIYSSDAERTAMAHIVELASVPKNRPGPVLLKKP
jgi:hypothetical protein